MSLVPDRAKLSILIADPIFESAKTIEATLREGGFAARLITRVSGLHEAVDALRGKRISVCLTNKTLDESHTAHDLIARTLKMPTPPPVIVMSDKDDMTFDESCQIRGAVHFILKREITVANLERLIRYIAGQHQKTTDQAFAAQFDRLTGLTLQSAFMDRLTQAIHRSDRSENPVCIARLDIRDFESVNTTYSHNIGDMVLKAVAHRLESKTRKTDTVARLGGDEFACLLENFGPTNNAINVLRKLVLGLKAPIRIDGKTFDVSIAIGVAFFPNNGAEPDRLMHQADIALQSARVDVSNTDQSALVIAS